MYRAYRDPDNLNWLVSQFVLNALFLTDMIKREKVLSFTDPTKQKKPSIKEHENDYFLTSYIYNISNIFV